MGKKKRSQNVVKKFAEQTSRRWLNAVNPTHDHRAILEADVKPEPSDHWMYYSNLGGAESRGAKPQKRKSMITTEQSLVSDCDFRSN
jgi:hypothetical protein